MSFPSISRQASRSVLSRHARRLLPVALFLALAAPASYG